MSDTQIIPNLKTSWIGNTWAGGSSWMQNYIDDMIVDANGHCWTYSGWDEGHNERGEYYFENGQWKVIKHGSNDVPQVSSKTVILNNITWNINPDGSVTGGGKILPSLVKATALGIYHPLGLLIVADDGVGQHVVKFYNITTPTPTLVKTFGTVGGITAGIAGEVTKLKFWGMNGIGADAAGNLYVAISQEGVILRRYVPTDVNSLTFDTVNVAEAYGFHFMDHATFDPTKDGLEVWGKNEHYLIDYSKPAGQQWKLVGYTIDKDRFPDDPRLFGSGGGVKIKYKDGQRFMFFLAQNQKNVFVFKFEGEIAVPFFTITELIVSIDDNCDIWLLGGDTIDIMRCIGIQSGNLKYSSRTQYCPIPAPYNKVTHLLYDLKHDIMYLGGGSKDNPTQGWGHMAPIVCRYNNWSTTRDLKWEIAVPWFHNEAPVDQRIVPISWDVAGERLYIGYSVWDTTERFDAPYNDCPGPIRVYSIKDGSYIGRLLPDQTVFYGCSWLDIYHAVSAFERTDGTQLVIREEDWKNKNLLYSYNLPDNPTKIAKVWIEKFTNGNVFLNTTTIVFAAAAQASSGLISKIELYANGILVGTKTTSPYEFPVTNSPVGEEVTFQAVAYDDAGGRGFSDRIYVKISDGTPEVKITTPIKNIRYLKNDAIQIKVAAVDYDGTINKVEFFANNVKVGETANPGDPFIWNASVIGVVSLHAKVTDNSGKTGTSPVVPIRVDDYKPAEPIQNITPGVRYRYYEGNFGNLPNFDTLTPIKTGIQTDFSLTNKNRDGNYAFRFDGYIKIDVAGLYTFYTASDDGSMLYIGNTLIVDNNGSHGTKEESGRILLQTGYHKYTLDYGQGEGGAELKVYHEGPGISKVLIPSGVLFQGTPVTEPPPPPPQPPKVIKAVSRKTHGTKGTYDIPLSLLETDPVSSISVECRNSAKHSIIINFDKPIASLNVILEPAAGKKATLSNWAQNNTSSITINLDNVSDAQLLKIKLNNITGTDGTKGNAVLRLRLLIGDIDGDGIVSQTDKDIMESYLAPNSLSFRADIQNNGSFNSTDLQSVTNRIGWKIT
jgi:hypothetical protein